MIVKDFKPYNYLYVDPITLVPSYERLDGANMIDIGQTKLKYLLIQGYVLDIYRVISYRGKPSLFKYNIVGKRVPVKAVSKNWRTIDPNDNGVLELSGYTLNVFIVFDDGSYVEYGDIYTDKRFDVEEVFSTKEREEVHYIYDKESRGDTCIKEYCRIVDKFRTIKPVKYIFDKHGYDLALDLEFETKFFNSEKIVLNSTTLPVEKTEYRVMCEGEVVASYYQFDDDLFGNWHGNRHASGR